MDLPTWPLDRVAVAGVGLLGGSLGLALKKRGLARCVVGCGRSRARLDAARESGCIDEAQTDFARAVAGARLVILCQPVSTIIECFPACFEALDDGAVVTDVGSTKSSIVAAGEAAAARRGGGTVFVGSHPMAGSERSGWEHSDAELYQGATCHVTVTPETPAEAAAWVGDFWARVGSRVVFTHPEQHDRMVAAISHVPHLVAVALMESLDGVGSHPQFQDMVVGPGFRDMTRVAMGSTDMWIDICRENGPAIMDRLDAFVALARGWRDRIAEGRFDEARALFDAMRERRSSMTRRTKTEAGGHDAGQ